MKVLFLMDSPEYLRFYDSAIEELAARGHHVAIAVNNQRSKKPVGLEGLQAYADRVSVLGVVPESDGLWGNVARRLRGTMDFVRFLHPAFAEAPALRARMKRKVLPRAYHWLDRITTLSPSTLRRVLAGLSAAERAVPLYGPMVTFLREQAPDLLLVSPLVAAASGQVDWIKAAQACGIRTAVCVASWDNLTNKGLLRVQPDAVIVWNEAQRQEAQEYHSIPPERVVATGAQLFDRWFAKMVTRDRAAFCARVGLPDDRPFVLFTGSSSFISRSQDEVAFVRRWIAALRQSGDPVLRTLNVLVRPHPYNFHDWGSQPLADVSGVSVFPRQGYNPILPENRDDFYDSLYHSAAVVGINTSAMIEAAIVGRPVCSMLAPEFAGTQEGTIHFHHLLPENGGFLDIAATLEQHVAQLRECLSNPAATRARLDRFVASFIRPNGIDRPATPAFADAVERVAHQPAPAPSRHGAMSWLLRPLVVAAVAPALIVDRFADADAWPNARKRALSVIRPMQKRVTKLNARWKRFLEEAW